MHRRKDVFGEDADEFRPERWEDIRVGYVPLSVFSSLSFPIRNFLWLTQLSSSLYRWEYIPFSGGPRICLGQQFALTQIEYALFKFFRVFKSIEPRDADSPLLLCTNLTVTFANGCLLSAIPDSK